MKFPALASRPLRRATGAALAVVLLTLPATRSATATLRSLAYKWIRILWRCWKEHTPYDETLYLAKLRTKASPLLKYLPELNTPKAA